MRRPDRRTPMKVRKVKTDRFRWSIWKAFCEGNVLRTEPLEEESHAHVSRLYLYINTYYTSTCHRALHLNRAESVSEISEGDVLADLHLSLLSLKMRTTMTIMKTEVSVFIVLS